MEAYFDNSATTRVLDCVRDIVVKTMTEDYANPAAKHRRGMEAVYPTGPPGDCQDHEGIREGDSFYLRRL